LQNKVVKHWKKEAHVARLQRAIGYSVNGSPASPWMTSQGAMG